MGASELSVIVPAYNERPNLPGVVEALDRVLAGIDWEVIIVDDDSPDGSYGYLVELAQRHPHVRFVRRVGRKGLSSACLEGMGTSAATYLAVMDADLQHDESILPMMFQRLRDADCDLVIGSRYVSGGGIGGWSRQRAWLSRFGTKVGSWVARTPVTDPLSGFFMTRRSVYDAAVRRMSGTGFKILLDLILSYPGRLRVAEEPYTFRPRRHGESKLDVLVGLEYLYLLVEKTLGRYLPVAFVVYVLVGGSGLIFHLLILSIMHLGLGQPFWSSQVTATLAAMLTNFLINNLVTFRSRRLQGYSLVIGAAVYGLVCGLGAVANVEVADYLFRHSIPWWIAGVAGAGIGAVWNYAVSKQVVWGWIFNFLRVRRRERDVNAVKDRGNAACGDEALERGRL